MSNQNLFASASKQQKVVAKDGGAAAWFGSAVRVEDDIALVGAKNATVGSNIGQGVVYAFKRVQGIWKQTQKLIVGDGKTGDQFGAAIAVHGKTAIITAPNASRHSKTWIGLAYVFLLKDGKWFQTAVLSLANSTAFDNFGRSVALSDRYAFLGAGGALHAGSYVPLRVYVFRRVPRKSEDIWEQHQVLDAPNPSDPTSAFGASMSISGNSAMIGASTATFGMNPGQGAVYVYQNAGGKWTYGSVLMASDPAARSNFGVSVSLQDRRAMIGSPGSDLGNGVSQGAVYEFHKIGSTWTEVGKISARDGASLNLFGASTNLHGKTLLVGAYGAQSYRGAAYLFRSSLSGWRETRKLSATSGSAGDVFGYYTSLSEGVALVGAYGTSVNGNSQQGAAFFFSLPQTESDNDVSSI